jgi:hypothetical protein
MTLRIGLTNVAKTRDIDLSKIYTQKQDFLKDLKKASQRKPKTSQSAPKQS